MTPNPIWQQSRLAFTFEVVGIAIALAILAFLAVSIRNFIKRKGLSADMFLYTLPVLRSFTVARYVLAFAGIASLIVTMLPGLMPFKKHVNQNLGLGGIALFILWPFIVAQIVLGFLSSEKYLKKEPVLVWMLLIIVYIIALNIDKTAIALVYNL